MGISKRSYKQFSNGCVLVKQLEMLGAVLCAVLVMGVGTWPSSWLRASHKSRKKMCSV